MKDAVLSQGFYTNWNDSGGYGETSFINSKGDGLGGFKFYNVSYDASNSSVLLMDIDGQGSINLNEKVSVNGVNGNAKISLGALSGNNNITTTYSTGLQFQSNDEWVFLNGARTSYPFIMEQNGNLGWVLFMQLRCYIYLMEIFI